MSEASTTSVIRKLPIVAIVGRPNVGKSSLLNVLAGRRVSIVDPTAGTTRDRVTTIVEHRDAWFELVDTGGLGVEDVDRLTENVEQQIRYAVAEASLILFVVDLQAGVQPLDEQVAAMLRRIDRPVILVTNKSDNIRMDLQTGEFYALGFGDPQPTSAAHKRGIEELLDRAMEHIGYSEAAPTEPVMKLAVVGKRNVGKSTFINSLAGEERVIVSEVPGTTRDSVDVRFARDGQEFVAIDTAGVRKKGKFDSDIEFYSFARAQRSIRRADVVLLLIDATQPVTDVDKKLSRYVADLFKPVAIVVSKWDLAEQKDRDDPEAYQEYLGRTLPGIDYAPIAMAAAKEHRGVWEVVKLALDLFSQSQTRVGTAELNKALRETVEARQPISSGSGKSPKFYYLSQVAVRPPTVVAFVNDPGLLAQDYKRFLLNRLREILPYGEVPIRLLFRSHHRDKNRE